MERELEPQDPAKTKAEGKQKDTKEQKEPFDKKRGTKHLNTDTTDQQEKNSGIKEDQPGRDPRGDRNSL